MSTAAEGVGGGGGDAPAAAAKPPAENQKKKTSRRSKKPQPVYSPVTEYENYGNLAPIGKGKFATVYRGIRKIDGMHVAVKRVHLFGSLSGKKREKVIKEARILESLSHPNIIAYLDSFVDDQDLMIVCEWAEAGDLKYQVRKALAKGIRFQEYTIWKYFLQIAKAICYMHEQRVMHRDLKPANIFITAKAQIKVGDLGLCRGFSANTNFAYTKVGTPLYMSPEVIEGQGYEWKSDVWSLGCILYELAVLRSPFKEPGLKLVTLFKKIREGSYKPIPSNYSPALRELVDRMLALDPKDRPDMTEVVRVAHEMKAIKMRERALRRAKQRAQKVLRHRGHRQVQRSATEGSVAQHGHPKVQRSTTESSVTQQEKVEPDKHKKLYNLEINVDRAGVETQQKTMPEAAARISPDRDRDRPLSPAVRRAAHASKNSRDYKERGLSPDQKARLSPGRVQDTKTKSPISPAVRRAAQASAMKADTTLNSQRQRRSVNDSATHAVSAASVTPAANPGRPLESMNILQYAREMGRRTAIQLKRRNSKGDEPGTVLGMPEVSSSGPVSNVRGGDAVEPHANDYHSGRAKGRGKRRGGQSPPSRRTKTLSASPIECTNPKGVRLNSIAPRSLSLCSNAADPNMIPAPLSARDKVSEHLPNITSRPLTEPSDFMSGIDPELRKQLRDMKRHHRDL